MVFTRSPAGQRTKDLILPSWDWIVTTRTVGGMSNNAHQTMSALAASCAGYDITTLGDDYSALWGYNYDGTPFGPLPQVETGIVPDPPGPQNLSWFGNVTGGQLYYHVTGPPAYYANALCANQRWRVHDYPTGTPPTGSKNKAQWVFYWYGRCVVGTDQNCASLTVTMLSDIQILYDSGYIPADWGTVDAGGWPTGTDVSDYVATFPTGITDVVCLFINQSPTDLKIANPTWSIV